LHIKQFINDVFHFLETGYTYIWMYGAYLLYDPHEDYLNTQNGIPYISYTYKNKTYHVLIDDRKGPSDILKITSDGDFDCTEQVRPFLGPSGIPKYSRLTPSTLGFTKLTFYTLRNGVVQCTATEDIYHAFKRNNIEKQNFERNRF